MTFGYDYVHKDKDTLTPENTTIFPTTAANADVQLAGFRLHTISHLLLNMIWQKQDVITIHM